MNKTERLVSIDILRIVSMMGIIGLHVVNNGGVVASLNQGTLTAFSINLFRALLYTSVDIFAIISGYLCFEKKRIQIRRIVELWCVVLFYSIIISLLTIFIRPELVPDGISIIRSFFPPIEGRYWYITCYSLLFFLIPYINKLLVVLDEDETKRFIIILIGFLCLISFMGCYDYFRISYGYSSSWLVVCYIIGACLKKYGCKIYTNNYILLLTIFCFLLLSSWSTLIYSNAGETLKHYMRGADWLLEYNSPLTVGSACCIVVIATRIKKQLDSKIVKMLSGATFGVYILHSHPIIYDYYIKDAFSEIGEMPAAKAILELSASILGIFCVCSVIEMLRMFLCNRIIKKRIVNS